MSNSIHEVFPYLRVGERIAKLLDPFGHDGMIGTHIEDVTPEETQRRFSEMLEGPKSNNEAKES
ncbi:MAG: hypothetical protein ABI614_20485 [Planctomycetota bacterium]